MTDRLIGVDWGSTAFRAWLFEDGRCTDAMRDPSGELRSVADGAFEAHLTERVGAWFRPAATMLLSGMVTSRNGWVETPYLACPVAAGDLLAAAVWRDLRGMRLGFLPGVAQTVPHPDVMRGEEIQVLGAVESGTTATVLLPGTHSKWVMVEDGHITGLRTYLTGELYALVLTQSLAGRLAKGDAPCPASFARGVAASAGGSLLSEVFLARSGVLLGQRPAEGVADFLSGLMIGAELRAGLAARGGSAEALLLLGQAALCARYGTACDLLGAPWRRSDRPAFGAYPMLMAGLAAHAT